MSIMSDRTIARLCTGAKPMITPFSREQISEEEYNGTEEEFKICTGALTAEEALARLRQRDPTYTGVRTDPILGLQVRKKIISYGCSSYGYDVRLAPEYKVFTNINSTHIDPLNFDPKCYQEREGEYCIIPPHSFILARTVEQFDIPRDVLVVCVGKSTYARTGCIVNVTPLEPEWKGFVTLELSNTTPLPLKVYAGMGIAQLLFFKGDLPCDISYADRRGKYQNQVGVVPPKV